MALMAASIEPLLGQRAAAQEQKMAQATQAPATKAEEPIWWASRAERGGLREERSGVFPQAGIFRERDRAADRTIWANGGGLHDT